MTEIAASKINMIRRHFLAPKRPALAGIARELNIQYETVSKYLKEFEAIARSYPSQLTNFKFRLPRKRKSPHDGDQAAIFALLPELAASMTNPYLVKEKLWKAYRERYPKGCSLNTFYQHFKKWQQANHVCRFLPSHIKTIPDADRAELIRWQQGNDTELWKKAMMVLGSYLGRTLAELAAQTETAPETILKTFNDYKINGLEALRRKPFVNPKTAASNQQKQDNIRGLLQQTPQLYAINRAAWNLVSLSKAYGQIYSEPLSTHAIGHHLQKMGYRFQKSREEKTSPDKNYQQKMDRIKSILSGLATDEKFFSVDEYGPATVTAKTGWSLTRQDETKSVPSVQKSKGWYIITAALELSTNQVTHFYSFKKNGEEMFKLFRLLTTRYKGNSRIYILWDDASWHRSKWLLARLQEINDENAGKNDGSAEIVLVPLPTSTTYLNVIESVFSGLARAVLHNSNYGSVEECHAAIDRHFAERNEHFRANPKKAGRKIWGQEIVKPFFSDTNDCKKRLIKG